MNVLGGFIHRPINRAGNNDESAEGTRRSDPRQWFERECLSVMITNTEHSSNDSQNADLTSSKIGITSGGDLAPSLWGTENFFAHQDF